MIEINWMLGFGNSPYTEVHEDLDVTPREECEFTFSDGIFYHIQANGLVRYFSHSGGLSNEGGYGGSAFTFLFEGKPRTVYGPWSSRAACVNMRVPAEKQIADINLHNRHRHPIRTAMLVSELARRWDDQGMDCFLLRGLRNEGGEQGPITVSMEYNRLVKPDGQVDWVKYDDYEIFANPAEGAY